MSLALSSRDVAQLPEMNNPAQVHQYERLTFRVAEMDCPAEEQLVRMQLDDRLNVQRLAFDLAERMVVVTHTGDSQLIEQAMADLNLGARLVDRMLLQALEPESSAAEQRKLLIIVLLINAGMFVIELLAGLIAHSMGLVADGMDMLVDAIVYGLSLYAVGRSAFAKRRVAQISGYFQMVLAVLGISEVIRRFLGAGEQPDFVLMIVISLIALCGNVASLVVLRQTQSREAHIRASQIFTSNDVLVNIGVIVAAMLVVVTASKLPDLLIGAIVFCLVGYGAVRILRLS